MDKKEVLSFGIREFFSFPFTDELVVSINTDSAACHTIKKGSLPKNLS